MINKSKNNLLPNILRIIIIIVIFFIQNLGVLSIKSLHANPILILSYLVAFSMFSEETVGAFTGLAIGIFLDAFSSSGFLFHTVILFFVGLAVSITLHYLLNNNIRCAIMLSILASLLYYVLRWLFYHSFSVSSYDSTGYLMQYALPSVIYTSIFIIPFYYLEKYLNSKAR